ncbi:MAG: bile acid:sodium symporter [Euryarchaeota archaeon]|nr:bile acid:sodium symporter [Euryarchaeota archaeon]
MLFGQNMRPLTSLVLISLILLSVSSFVVSGQDPNQVEDDSNFIVDVVLPISLAYIMFSLGIGLRVSDFSSIFTSPRAFATGLINQMVILPIVAFGIASMLSLSGEIAVGLMILACCPGGVTSNILTKISGGDTALSISYTAVVSVTSVLTLPLIVGYSIVHFMGSEAPEIEVMELGLVMFLLTTIPVTLGMAARHFITPFAEKAESVINNVATILFVLIVVAAIISEFDTLMDNIALLGPAVILLNVVMLGSGLGSSTLMNLKKDQAMTVSIESGIQNATVGITIGGLIMAPETGSSLSALSLPSGVYGVMMYLVVIPFLFWRVRVSQDNAS